MRPEGAPLWVVGSPVGQVCAGWYHGPEGAGGWAARVGVTFGLRVWHPSDTNRLITFAGCPAWRRTSNTSNTSHVGRGEDGRRRDPGLGTGRLGAAGGGLAGDGTARPAGE